VTSDVTDHGVTAAAVDEDGGRLYGVSQVTPSDSGDFIVTVDDSAAADKDIYPFGKCVKMPFSL